MKTYTEGGYVGRRARSGYCGKLGDGCPESVSGVAVDQ